MDREFDISWEMASIYHGYGGVKTPLVGDLIYHAQGV
jgi:hypothetical protein